MTFFVTYILTLSLLAALNQKRETVTPMNIPLDKPLKIAKSPCRICRKFDSEWRLAHLCDDGVWRVLREGITPREYGIDGEDEALYFVHQCCEKFLYECRSRSDVEEFFLHIKE